MAPLNGPLSISDALLGSDLEELARLAACSIRRDGSKDINVSLHVLQTRWENFFQLLSNQLRGSSDDVVAEGTKLEGNNDAVGDPPNAKSLEADLANRDSLHEQIPLEMFRQVVASGFLTFQDLGRLLLLSSRSITSQLGHDFVWNSLCRCRLPGLLSLPELHSPTPPSGCSPEWVFRQFTKTVERPSSLTTWDPAALSPPRLDPENLLIVVQWYSNVKDDAPAAILPIRSLALEGFLQTGKVTVPAPANLSFLGKEKRHIHIKVHCLRLDRYECCCIHETGEFTWDASQPEPPSTVPNTQFLADGIIVNQDLALLLHLDAIREEQNHRHEADLFLGPRIPVLLDSPGYELETRLARGDQEPGGFELLVVAHATATDLAENIDRQDRNSLYWQVNQLTLEFWGNYNDQVFIYDTQEHAPKHGVTLLHILDQLRGWHSDGSG